MTYRKTNLTLPDDVASTLGTLDGEDRNNYITALRAGGWTLSSISKASGLTRERVRQIAERPAVAVSWRIPEPPRKPVRTPRTYVEPDPRKLARLKELQPLAQKVRANSSENRAEAEEYTALLWEVHNTDGVTLYRLAKRLGVTHGALRFRLARYGYKLPETGVSKVYTRIDPENRVRV